MKVLLNFYKILIKTDRISRKFTILHIVVQVI
nr:MAG TPA: hypothetical protein [Inoviridae sp.]